MQSYLLSTYNYKLKFHAHRLLLKHCYVSYLQSLLFVSFFCLLVCLYKAVLRRVTHHFVETDIGLDQFFSFMDIKSL